MKILSTTPIPAPPTSEIILAHGHNGPLSFFLSILPDPLSSIIGRCTLYTPFFLLSLIHEHYIWECEFGNFDKIKNKNNTKKQNNQKCPKNVPRKTGLQFTGACALPSSCALLSSSGLQDESLQVTMSKLLLLLTALWPYYLASSQLFSGKLSAGKDSQVS